MMRRRKTYLSRLVLTMSLSMVCSAHAADRVYVGTDEGLVFGFDGFNRSFNAIGDPNDTNFAIADVDGPGASAAINVMAAGQSGTLLVPQVMVGLSDGSIRRFTKELNFVVPPPGSNPWIPSGLPFPATAAPIQGLAVGSLGPDPNFSAVVTAHPIPDPTNGVSILVANDVLQFKKNFPFTGTPDPDLTGIAIADLDPNRPGNEFVVTLTKTDPNSTDATPVLDRSTGFVGAFAYELVGIGQIPTITPLWDNGSGSPWFNVNNVISGVVTGDFIADPNGATGPWDEIALLGNIPDPNAPNAPAGPQFGRGTQLFQPRPDLGVPAPFPDFVWQNGLGETQDDIMVTGAASNVRTDIAGDEIIVAGNSELRIINSATGATEQIIETNQDVTAVAVADVLGNDGVDEIIAVSAANVSPADFDLDLDVDGFDFLIWQQGNGQFDPNNPASRQDGDANGDNLVNDADLAIWETEYGSADPNFSTGLILVYEHTTPGDATTDFGIDTTSFSYGALFQLGDNSLTSITILDGSLFPLSAVSAVPEPGSYVLALCGLIALWRVDRRSHSLC